MSNYGPLGPFFLILVNILDTRNMIVLYYIYDTGRMSFHDLIPSALHLNERGILNKPKLVPEVYKLFSGQKLCKNISNFLISGDILELHCSLMHHVMNEVVLYLDLNRLIMEIWILCQLHISLIITIYHARL